MSKAKLLGNLKDFVIITFGAALAARFGGQPEFYKTGVFTDSRRRAVESHVTKKEGV